MTEIHSTENSPHAARLTINPAGEHVTVTVERFVGGNPTQGATGTFDLAEIRDALEPPTKQRRKD